MNWIDIKYKLPKNKGLYLVAKAGSWVSFAHFIDNEFIKIKEITHWMELPKPPNIKKERKDKILKINEKLYTNR